MELGADLVGFVLAPSPRKISLQALKELTRAVPAQIITVAVVVNPTMEEADQILDVVDRIQFHGSEPPDFCRRYGRRAIKAFRIRKPGDLKELSPYNNSVGGFLLDSFRAGQAGGTGHTFPWEYLKGHRFSKPVLLAGGLKPNNVEEAWQVEAVQGIDVSSGLESEPGVKDESLMIDFFHRINQFRSNSCRH